MLYREGARADTMYVLLSGTLEHSSGSYQVLEANPRLTLRLALALAFFTQILALTPTLALTRMLSLT